MAAMYCLVPFAQEPSGFCVLTRKRKPRNTASSLSFFPPFICMAIERAVPPTREPIVEGILPATPLVPAFLATFCKALAMASVGIALTVGRAACTWKVGVVTFVVWIAEMVGALIVGVWG